MFLKYNIQNKVSEENINKFNNIDEELIIPKCFLMKKAVVINLPITLVKP